MSIFLLSTLSYLFALPAGAALFFYVLQFRKRWKEVQRPIRTYAANGRRLSDSSLERAERLIELGQVVARKDRHGRIRLIQFKHDCGAYPLQTTAHTGTHYSYEQPLPSGHYAWTHRELVRDEHSLEALFGDKPDNREEADRFVRAIFRAVPLSCIAKAQPKEPKPAAKVIDIGQYRRSVSIDTGQRQAA